MTQRSKNILLTAIIILIIVVAAIGYAYSNKESKKNAGGIAITSQSNHAATSKQAPQTVKAPNVNIRPLLMPLSLPLAQAGTVQTNQYTTDYQAHTVQGEYVYTQKNPTGSTVEQQYQETLKQNHWQNIAVNGSTLSATLSNCALQVTFADAGNATTKVSLNYTVTQNNANEK